MTIRVVALSLLLASVAAPASAEPPSFAFLRPGETRIDEAVRRLGKPWVRTIAYVVAGEVDPFVDVPSAGAVSRLVARAAAEKRKAVPVSLLLWPAAPDHPCTFARLVFSEDGVLRYALLPPSPSEATASKLAERYPGRPDTSHSTLEVADLREDFTLYRYPRLGLGFLEERGKIREKIVFGPTLP